MSATAIVIGIILAPVLIRWALRRTGVSHGPGSGDGDGSFADLSGWSASDGGNSGGDSCGGGSDGGGGCD